MASNDPIDRRWQRIEDRNAKKMLAIWERSRKELLADLLESGPNDQSLTAQHRQKMLVQVERQIERLKPETSTLLTAIGSDGLTEGATNASKDVGLHVGPYLTAP